MCPHGAPLRFYNRFYTFHLLSTIMTGTVCHNNNTAWSNSMLQNIYQSSGFSATNSDANIQSDAWSCRVRFAVAKTGLKWESRLGI